MHKILLFLNQGRTVKLEFDDHSEAHKALAGIENQADSGYTYVQVGEDTYLFPTGTIEFIKLVEGVAGGED